MNTQGNSIPYRYAPAQLPQNSGQLPYRHQLQPTTASTSTASAFAYAQQQQQLANRQSSLTQSSPSPSTYTPYIPSPIRQSFPQEQPKRPSPLADRPHSIEELAKIASQGNYNRFGDIKQDLRRAEVYLSAGKKDYEAGDLEWAFIHFARAATLVLQKMPTNTHYHDMKDAHRATLADNGNFCLERMSEIKPTLVDRYELWRQRHPKVKPELDMARMLSAMTVRDNEELALRAQTSKLRRAASKGDAVRRSRTEEENREQEEKRRQDEEARKRAEATRQPPQDYDTAARHAYEDARRKQEDFKRRQAEEARLREAEANAKGKGKAITDSELERRKREVEEDGRRRQEEIARRRNEEAQRQKEAALRQEQEAATQRKAEEIERIRQRDETKRKEVEESTRQEQEGIARRQREAEAEAQASRSMLKVQVPALLPPPPSSSSSSGSSKNTAQSLTPRQDGLPVLPLESPTRMEAVDPRSGRHHPQPQHAMPDRALARTNGFRDPITTTSPPPKEGVANWSRMTEHQRAQGYTPSLQSMFVASMTGPPTGLLFSPNHPEGPSAKNMPSSPDRPPAHIRHMWELAGYDYSHAYPEKSRPRPPPRPTQADMRILRPEQVREREDAVFHRELHIVKVPQAVLSRFLNVAAVNTARNKETCGLLMGREEGEEYKVVTLLIPKQRSTSDTCTMEEEELVSEFTEKRGLMTLGWIHTHPTQSCFMSSLDLHTHAGFQSMLPEFFAVVCSPKHVPNFGIFRLTDPPGLKTILKCQQKAAFHPHSEQPIYTDADKGHVVWSVDGALEIVDLR